MKKMILVLMVVFSVPVAFFASEKEVTVAVEDFTFVGAMEDSDICLLKKEKKPFPLTDFHRACIKCEKGFLSGAIVFTVLGGSALAAIAVYGVIYMFAGIFSLVALPFAVLVDPNNPVPIGNFLVNFSEAAPWVLGVSGALVIVGLIGIPIFWAFYGIAQHARKYGVEMDAFIEPATLSGQDGCSVGFSIGLF